MNEKKNFRKRVLPTGHSDLEIGKLPPQATELEDAVLGAVLIEDEAYHQVADMLVPDVFYKEQNGRICEAIINLKNKGHVVDILTVTNELKRMECLELVGGAYYVSALTNRIASSANIEHHMRIVLEKFILRSAIQSASILITNAYQDSTDPFDIVDEYEKNLNLITSKLFVTKSTDMGSLFHKMVDFNSMLTSSKEALIGVSTGFHDLNVINGGWQKSDLVILAARPGMGKTAMVIGFAKHAAAYEEKPTLIFSLEQSELQLFHRMCSQETEIPLDKFIKTGLDQYDLVLVDRDTVKLKTCPLYIDDTGGQSIFDIRTKARKMKREKKIELIVIDYLQLITVTNSDKMGNREQEVSMISRSLKALAKELDIPIIALSQLSRNAENRPGSSKIPQLSDLRDSGSIEQDADMVAFIYRPEYYGMEVDANNNPTKGLAQLIIAKNRHGALGTVNLRWKAECTLFKDYNGAFREELPAPQPIQTNNNFLTEDKF